MVKNANTHCPYNAEHRMKYTRLIYHLAKGCPDMKVNDYEICIYNWVHRVPMGTLESHYLECEFKPKPLESEWNTEVDMEIWTSAEWNYFAYDKAWPPEWFPDF